MSAFFEIKQANNGQYFFNLKAVNGEIILNSETYKSKRGVNVGIVSVRKNSLVDRNYILLSTTTGEPYFILKAKNGEIIGKSEIYSSAQATKIGLASVKRNATNALLIDKTIQTTKKKDIMANQELKPITTNSDPCNPGGKSRGKVTMGNNDLEVNPDMDFRAQIVPTKAKLENEVIESYYLTIKPYGSVTLGPGGMPWNDDNKRGWFRREMAIEFGPIGDSQILKNIDPKDWAPHAQSENDSYVVRTKTGFDLGLDKDGPSARYSDYIEKEKTVQGHDFEVEMYKEGMVLGWRYALNRVIDQWSDSKDEKPLKVKWTQNDDSGIRNLGIAHRLGLYQIPSIAYNATTFQNSDIFSCELNLKLIIPDKDSPYTFDLFYGCVQNLWALWSNNWTQSGTSFLHGQGGLINVTVKHDGIDFGNQRSSHYWGELMDMTKEGLSAPGVASDEALKGIQEYLIKN